MTVLSPLFDRLPDPLRAHGVWVYLIVCVLAGTVLVADRGLVPALLAGGVFVGALVLVGAAATPRRRTVLTRLAVGLLSTLGSLLLALDLGADRSFLVVSLLALPPAVAAAWLGRARGFLSPPALSCGVAVLTVSAPAAACAGGASPREALVLLCVLQPFFVWRTWRLARALGRGWTRARLRRRGLLESGLAIAWAAAAVLAVRLLG